MFKKREYELWKLPLDSSFCAVTADSKSKWPHGKRAYFRDASYLELEQEGLNPGKRNEALTLSLPRVIIFKFMLQPHQE